MCGICAPSRPKRGSVRPNMSKSVPIYLQSIIHFATVELRAEPLRSMGGTYPKLKLIAG